MLLIRTTPAGLYGRGVDTLDAELLGVLLGSPCPAKDVRGTGRDAVAGSRSRPDGEWAWLKFH